MGNQERANYELALKLKDEEIARQIEKRKLAERTRDLAIIIGGIVTVLISIL